MPTYIVTRKSDGAEVYRYQVDGPAIEWVGMEFATHDHTEQAEQVEPVTPVTVYGGRRILSPLEFLRLLTAEERIATRTAAKTNAALEDYLDLIDKAEEINLDNMDVVNGLNMLEAVGLIGAGRAAEVLNG